MDPSFVLALLEQSLSTTIRLAGPLLGISMAVGLLVSILQAATQIQEMTLVFVPKMLAVFAAMLFMGTWMLDVIARFTVLIFNLVATAGPA